MNIICFTLSELEPYALFELKFLVQSSKICFKNNFENFKPTTGVVTIKVPGVYYISVMFGVTKKAWYLHLRKNGVYIASVQKDYNHGYEDSLNLHALGK